jgi:hypothetical protein
MKYLMPIVLFPLLCIGLLGACLVIGAGWCIQCAAAMWESRS